MPDWDDTDYSTLAVDYANVRRPDPRIGAQLVAALGAARTVLNVGAGTGSYEPTDREVTAVEPSAEMRAKRDPALPPAIDATADALPFEDDSFDGRYPSLDRITEALGGRLAVRPLTIPLDCRDGFVDAFYGRPEAMLDPAVRRAQSGWSFIADAEDAQARFAARLSDDLDLGVWDERFGHLRTQPEFVGSIRVLVG
jgi:hypothetical protein